MQQGATQGCFPPSGLVAGLRGCRRRAYPPHCSIPAGLSSLASCRSGSAASGSELQRRDPPAARPPPLPPRSLPHAAPRTARRPGCTVPGSLFQLAGDRGSPRAWRVQTGECHARAPVAFPCQSLRVSGCPGLGGPPLRDGFGGSLGGRECVQLQKLPSPYPDSYEAPPGLGLGVPPGENQPCIAIHNDCLSFAACDLLLSLRGSSRRGSLCHLGCVALRAPSGEKRRVFQGCRET